MSENTMYTPDSKPNSSVYVLGENKPNATKDCTMTIYVSLGRLKIFLNKLCMYP